jgi:hypothetical protein
MEKRVLNNPLYLKIITLIFTAMPVPLICFVSYGESYGIYGVFAGFSLLGAVLFYFCSVKYTIDHEYLTVEYPLLYKKAYRIKDIIGYTFSYTGTDCQVTLFFDDDSKFSLSVCGKKMRNQINDFFKEIYEDVKQKTIIKLMDTGLTFKLNRKRDILFRKDDLKITNKDGTSEHYYYKEDVKRIEFQTCQSRIFVTIRTTDDKKIQFGDYTIKGRIGLLEHLSNECNKQADGEIYRKAE